MECSAMPASISVIIPVYNGARFIRDALRSVCTQTYLPIEVVVVDDVSTDNTREVVNDYARTSPVPITLLRMETNSGGPYGPARHAFDHTTGEYVCILDADDEFVPDAFATYLAMFEAGPQATLGLATSDFLTFADATGDVVMPSWFATQSHLLKQVIEDKSPTGVLVERAEAVRWLASAFVLPFKGLVARRAWEALGGPNLCIQARL